MIAVIGMAGRFPGAPDLRAYWDLLANGREGIGRLDADELLASGVPAEVLADPRYVPAAAVLDGFDRFDASFWDIGGHEAALMDPQQRVLLELAWHALEDAGIDPRRTDASIGVFVGAAISTYLLFQLRQTIAGPSAPSQLLAMMGNDKDYMATQLAYRLDLKGPAVSVQTACSSSLVAVHMACQSLLSGECDIALAGGVSVRVPHRAGYLHEAGGMLSPDGHCRSYAEDAAGTVFGSGAGLVVLRRAEDAGRDRVRALLLGSAVNNDGSRKIGFTAPSQDRQAAVIAEAMAVAEVRPDDIGCVEGHGTGTPLGDPVEVAALSAAYRGTRAGPVALGSAKSNIGHTETAAGVTGLIKAVLMLQHGMIAPTLHAEMPSSRIAWADTPFRLPGEARPWTERLVAGVSSFGIGGTNAHVVVGRAPETTGQLTASRLVISARDPVALSALVDGYRAVLAADPEAFPVLAGAATRRPRLPWWVAVESAEALASPSPGSRPPGLRPPGLRPPGSRPPVSRSPVSCPGLARAPTPYDAAAGEDVGARAKPGHDTGGDRDAGGGNNDAAANRDIRSNNDAAANRDIRSNNDAAANRDIRNNNEAAANRGTRNNDDATGNGVGSKNDTADSRDGETNDDTGASRAKGSDDGTGADRNAWASGGSAGRTGATSADPAPEVPATGNRPSVDLPLYPFQRSRHWFSVASDLLGPPLATPFGETLRQVALEMGLLRQHRVDGAPLLPAALHLALFAGVGPVADVAIERPLRLDGTPTIQLWQAADGAFRAVTERAGTWECLATARPADHAPPTAVWDTGEGPETDGLAWAATMAAAGLTFGPAFLPIRKLRRGTGGVRAEIMTTSPIAMLDAGLQALGAAVTSEKGGFLPASIARFASHGDILRACTVLARLTEDLPDSKTGDVLWLDGVGGIVAEAIGVVCRRVRAGISDMLHRLVWRLDDDPALTAPHDALERIAQGFARDALARVPHPARAPLAALLRRHASAADPILTDPSAVCRDLAARHPDHAAEIALVARCGAALSDVLAGGRDPLDVLFGAEDGAHGAYRASPLARRLNAVAGAVAAGGKPRRAIEIGGGTAATTRALRSALPDVADYLFTDISPAFLAGAERQFADWPTLRTAPLDVSRDPAEQGIETGTWDLVVAANVLHAAPDLAAALRHAARLLAPGGRLLLVEGTDAQARLDITFGLTDDWTRQSDRDLRPNHPLVSTETWHRLLRDTGLQDIVTVAELRGQVVLTAIAGPPRWIAVGRTQAFAATLDLPLVHPGAMLPNGRLDGVVALAGLEEGDGLGDLLALSRDLVGRLDAPRLLVPVPDPPSPAEAALGGFLRTLAREHPAIRARSVGLDVADLAPLAVERALDDGEDRIVWRGGQRMAARLEPLRAVEPPVRQRLAHDLTLTACPEQAPGANEVLIRVRAAGINYKDVLTAAGQVPPVGPGLGGECAGEVEAIGPGVTGIAPGDAVIAVAAGSLATHVRVDARLVMAKPAGLDFAHAASVPIAGVTAWHALHRLARIRPGQRVLVHAATGGVGWFAVRLAQQAGAEVVATAGTPEKRARLAALGVREAYSSRDAGFAAASPVDVVLGALSAAQRNAAVRLLRPGGHYIEIGRGSATETPPARADIAWHLVALDRVEAPEFAALLREVLDAVAADPTLLPPVRTVPLARAAEAFGAMMRAEHVGKLVAVPARPLAIRQDGSYLVTGGLGGLGPEIAAWLARRGAGGVVRLARNAPAGATSDDVVVGDVADGGALRAVDMHLARRGLPPVRGVIHAAGVLEDGTVTALDPGSFARVAAPKLAGLRAIQAHWPDLDLLVGFSSAGALFGSAGQASHTAASAALDAALAGAADAGFPAVAIDWGAWRDRGAALAHGATLTLGAGMGSIATADGFAALDRILEDGVSHAAVLPIDRNAMRQAGIEPPLLRDAAKTPDPAVVSPAPTPREAPAGDRRAWLQERVAAECAAMLAIRGTIESRRPLQELGLDSLAALELRNRLGRLAGAVLPASLLFDYPTVASLTDYLAASHFGLSPEPVATPAPAAPAPDMPEDASDEELDATLSAFAALHGGDA